MTISIAVSPAHTADLSALHALIESAYRGESARGGWTHEADLLEGPRTSIEALAAILDDPEHQRLLMFREGDALIGCVHLTRTAPGVCYLGMLTVAPGRQAGGLGRYILGVAEAEARETCGAQIIELSVVSQRAELIAYYERRGYAPTGEMRPFPIPLDPPFFLAVMAKSLSGHDRS